MNTWPQVDKLKNGRSLDEDTLNAPIEQLAQRTDYLKRNLDRTLDTGSLILNDVTLGDSTLKVGDVVYRGEGGFVKAQAKMDLYDDFKAADSAFTIGILIEKNGEATDTGDVLIQGRLSTDTPIDVSSMLEDGETYRDGRYYLSSTEAGKITADPEGPIIYLGSFHSEDSAAYINPQFLDIGTSHVHRAYPMEASPVGTVNGTSVVGIFPDGYEDPEQYPSIIFGGAWTSENDVFYEINLSSGGSWGEVSASWRKDGGSKSGTVMIPAPGVFVELDNGLEVKFLFPKATSQEAYSGLSDSQRTWKLSMPTAGRGWVDHSVEAIASVVADSTDKLHVAFSGSWPKTENTAFCLFPTGTVNCIGLTSSSTTATVDGVAYTLTGTSLEDKARNLVAAVSPDPTTASVFACGSSLVYYGVSLTVDNPGETSLAACADFSVISADVDMSPMVVYDSDCSVIGSEPWVIGKSYRPVSVDGLELCVYADGATSSDNYTVQAGTRLMASAYDYGIGYAYDYVMGLHQSIYSHFPPVPAAAAGISANGVLLENAELFPSSPSYKIGHRTVHWKSSSRPPWSTSSTDSVKTLAMHFVVGFQGATGPVTSLKPAPDSPIKVYTYGTNDPAYAGDLMIDADMDISVQDAGLSGYNVVKQGKGGKLLAGPVVEKIIAGTGISITKSPGCPAGQGTVTIGLADGTMRGNFSEIALENAKQEKIGLFPYVGLLGWSESGNVPSAFTMMTRVSTTLDPNKNYSMNLRMVMFGTYGYDQGALRYAGLKLEYNILPDYTNDPHASLKTGILEPTTSRSIAVPLGHSDGGSTYSYTAYDPFVATTEKLDAQELDKVVQFSSIPIPTASEFSAEKQSSAVLKPGYLVAIRISRISTPGDHSAYVAPLGFLSLEWTLDEDEA